MESKDILGTVGVFEEGRELLAYLLEEEGIEAPRLQRIVPRTNREEVPLSFSQRRLWFVHQLDPDSACYNEPTAVRLVGRLNMDVFERCVNEIIKRHEILRAIFAAVEGVVVQAIRETINLTLPVVDLREFSTEERDAEIRRLALEEFQKPFDLSQGPLLRVKLIRTAEEEHVLLLTAHHIIFDGWSIGVFFDELAALYGAFCGDRPSPLSALPIQYADYAYWQRKFLEDQVLETHFAYWKEKLGGSLPVLELPTDRPRPAIQTTRGARHYISFPKSLAEALKALSQREEATLFMTLLAAFQTLLYRYTEQDDILVGSPVAGRNWAEVEPLIGCFLNTVVFRTDLSGNPSFRELLRQVRQVATEAYAHQEFPFEQLVEKLHPERDMSRNPLFQVMFVIQNSHQRKFPGLSMTPLRLDRGAAPFDLILSIDETAEELDGWWEYNTDLFDDATIRRFASHFRTMLEGATANPNQRLSDLPLLSRDEEHQVLVKWNQTRVDYPKAACLHHLFEVQVERTPEAVSVVFENEQLTYCELNHRSNQLAHYLQKLGVKPDVLVGICLERSLEMVVGLLGVLKAGGAYVPLDPEYPKERLAFMIEDSGVSVLLTQQRLGACLPEHKSRVIYLDRDWESIAQENRDNSISQVNSHSLAYVIYTSGSTGQPKGVMIPHRAICNHMFWMQDQFPLTADDRVVQKTPFSFDASVWEFYAPLIAGGRLIIARPASHRDCAYLIDLITRQQVTVLQLVPSLLQLILNEKEFDNCSSLRRVFCGGEILSTDLVKRFFERSTADLHNLYGPTEASIDATFWICRQDREQRNVPIGRPISNVQVFVLDSRLKAVPIGVPGELHIGGVGLARGYWNRPELTREKFIPNPFSSEPSACLYKTGDVARYRPDGSLEFLGRIDQQIKLRGFRIELGEIEGVLSQHPKILTSVVMIREDSFGDKRLVAYVVPVQWKPPAVTEQYPTARENVLIVREDNKGENDLAPHIAAGREPAPSMGELCKYLRQKLPEYMVPSAFVFLDCLPLTPNGKVDRKTLPSPDWNRSEVQGTYIAPRDAIEVQLTKIWEKVLGHGPIGNRDNFFELGGHSLLATQVIHQIRKVFERTVPVTVLFQAPTVEQLAAVLRNECPLKDWASLVPLQIHGSNPPFFFLAGRSHFGDQLGLEQPVYRVVYQDLDRDRPFDRIEDMASHSIISVRKMQPNGPYYLGGHAVGGMVGFEMAQQLLRDGERVALLALCECWVEPPRSRESRARRIWHKGRYHFRRARRLGTKQGLTDIVQNLKEKHGSAGFKHRIALTQIEQESRAAAFAAMSRYVPQVYSGRIALIRCSDRRPLWRDSDPLDGWGNLALGGVEVYEVPGRHVEIYRPPNVAILANALNNVLHKARGRIQTKQTVWVDSTVSIG
jgi:aspartate racemase